MPIVYNLTLELRQRLKRPLGILIKGSFIETMNRFKELAREEKPTRIIAVGDTVSKNLAKNQIMTQLSIVDNKCMRKRTQPATFKTEKTIHIKNPQATITSEAIAAIQGALQTGESTKIVVDGEEDLLALIAIHEAPPNSLVVYGQPYEGIVVVKVTPEKKMEITEILKTMQSSKS
jgi:uncharacterized protein (UPF0218 family)